MCKWKKTTYSAEETELLGAALGMKLTGGEIIELAGDLGSGKTTLAKGLAIGLGIEENVSSPTFTLSKIYKGKKLELHHYDFYRLGSIGVLEEDVKEVLENTHNVTVVEWAGETHNLFPKERTINVEIFSLMDENSRKILISLPLEMEQLAHNLGAEKC